VGERPLPFEPQAWSSVDMAVLLFKPASVGMLIPLLVGAMSWDCQAEGGEAKKSQVVVKAIELQAKEIIGNTKGKGEDRVGVAAGRARSEKGAVFVHAETCRRREWGAVARYPFWTSTVRPRYRGYRKSAVSQL
jgi:hypothetical protein